PTLHLDSFPTRRSSDLQVGNGGEHLAVAQSDEVFVLKLNPKCRSGISAGSVDPRLTSGEAADRATLDVGHLALEEPVTAQPREQDRKSTRLNSSHDQIS